MDKQEIVPKGYNDKAHLYYSFSPTPGVKFIALDCFEISILGYELDDQHENCTKAADLMLQKHGRVDHDLWDTNGELQGLEQRFQLQNGGISTKQLQWLDSELTLSDIQQERVIVFGHVCLLPQSCDPSCLLWNYDQVIACFARHPSVVAYLSGHAHESGNGTDSSGVHYVVFNGVIETPPDSDSFATLSLFHDRLLVDGYGKEHSTSLPLVDRFTNKSAELLTNSLVTMKGVRKVSDGPLVLVSV